MVAQQAVHDCEFVHLGYTQDLDPSYYFLFRSLKLKFRLSGTRFTDTESLKIVIEARFSRQDRKIFFQGVNSLEEQEVKVI